mmetsp:Transcript_35137/g.81243  ORF Transcript_35137/g.81243 Transcript_35137/m.81243 type:complete len:83 (-) Transcript_35137:247-495(-)
MSIFFDNILILFMFNYQNKKMTEETKEKRLRAEINNGRLAMLGIFGFLCADTIPGSVPALANIAIPYDGNCMVPFEGQFSYF